MLLADHLVEGLRTVAAVKRGLRAHRLDTSDGSSALLADLPRSARLALVADGNLLDHGRRIAELERKVSELYKRLGQAEPVGFGDDSGFSEPASVAASEDPRVIELVPSDKKIEAIKLYRELTGVGLAEAKDAVEGLAEQYHPRA
jgi:Ribosomal protein L7/L12 C-terminal domain